MTLDGLRCFCAVVETGSFRAAADRVHRSQPAVSQQIKALERECGHVIIERKTVTPTPSGQLIYDRARAILASADALACEVADFDETAVRELRVGTSDTTALYVLPPFVRRFASAMPQTRLVIVNRSSDAIADQVVRAELDLGIVTLPLGRNDLHEEELFQQRLVLVAPAKHPLARAQRVALAALKDEPMLLLDAHTRTGALLRAYFGAASFAPQVVLDSGSFEVIKRYVAEGVGVAFLPENVVGKHDEGLATVRVPGLPRVSIGVIWRNGAYRSKAARAFFELLRQGN
jgi:DNA-binding transcriptional LysR family regulator